MEHHWTLAKETNLLLHGGSPLNPFLAPQRPKYTMDDLKCAQKVLNPGISGLDGETCSPSRNLRVLNSKTDVLHAIEATEQVFQQRQDHKTPFSAQKRPKTAIFAVLNT